MGWQHSFLILTIILQFTSTAIQSHQGGTLESHQGTGNVVTDSISGLEGELYPSLVVTNDGPVQGARRKIRVDKERTETVDTFWGIPFAQAPVAELRFRRPVPVKPWSETLDATKPPPSCMQILGHPIPVYVPDPSTPVSEDCLYLNIWRPHCLGNQDPQAGTPSSSRISGDAPATMVFLHGGGYMSGSSTVSTYDGGVLAASQCVIVASMNYRLGALGFLYLGIPEVPGNMGLLDMALAIGWIKNNIGNFGGDPETITVFGQSAGGASTSLLLLSPLTQDLFARAIIQSGSPISHLATQSTRSALETAHEFSKAFDCYSLDENNTAVAECLKQVNADSLTEEHLNLVQDYRYFMSSVLDGYFLTETPIESFKTNNFKSHPVLLGSTKDEGNFFLGLKWPETYNFLEEQSCSISEQKLDQKLTEFFSDFLKYEHVSSVIDDVKHLYNLTRLRETEFDAHLSLLNYVIGDVINTCTVRQMAQFVTNSPNQAWLYRFNIPLPQSKHPLWVGAIHGADIDYVFGKVLTDSAYSENQTQVSHRMMSYFGNFAKYGYPTLTVSSDSWQPYNIATAEFDRHFVITENLEYMQMVDVGRARCDYWAQLPHSFLKN